MTARVALFAGCLLWLAYQSHFSPTYFAATVQTSLADIFGGISDSIAADNAATANPSVAAASSVYIKTAAQ